MTSVALAVDGFGMASRVSDAECDTRAQMMFLIASMAGREEMKQSDAAEILNSIKVVPPEARFSRYCCEKIESSSDKISAMDVGY